MKNLEGLQMEEHKKEDGEIEENTGSYKMEFDEQTKDSSGLKAEYKQVLSDSLTRKALQRKGVSSFEEYANFKSENKDAGEVISKLRKELETEFLDNKKKRWNEGLSEKKEDVKPKIESLFNNLTTKLADNKYANLVKAFQYYSGSFCVNFDKGLEDIISRKPLNRYDLKDAMDKTYVLMEDAKNKTKKATENLDRFKSRNFLYKFLHEKEGEDLLNVRHSMAIESRRLGSVKSMLEATAEFLEGMDSLFDNRRDSWNTTYLSELEAGGFFDELIPFFRVPKI